MSNRLAAFAEKQAASLARRRRSGAPGTTPTAVSSADAGNRYTDGGATSIDPVRRTRRRVHDMLLGRFDDDSHRNTGGGTTVAATVGTSNTAPQQRQSSSTASASAHSPAVARAMARQQHREDIEKQRTIVRARTARREAQARQAVAMRVAARRRVEGSGGDSASSSGGGEDRGAEHEYEEGVGGAHNRHGHDRGPGRGGHGGHGGHGNDEAQVPLSELLDEAVAHAPPSRLQMNRERDALRQAQQRRQQQQRKRKPQSQPQQRRKSSRQRERRRSVGESSAAQPKSVLRAAHSAPRGLTVSYASTPDAVRSKREDEKEDARAWANPSLRQPGHHGASRCVGGW